MVIMYSSVERGVNLVQAAGRARQPGSIVSVLTYAEDPEEKLLVKSERERGEIKAGIDAIPLVGRLIDPVLSHGGAAAPTSVEASLGATSAPQTDDNAHSVANLNEFCQRHGFAYPVYEYTLIGEQTWTCTCSIPGMNRDIVATSTVHVGKKKAKAEAAHTVLMNARNRNSF
jgi:hypothetical protein